MHPLNTKAISSRLASMNPTPLEVIYICPYSTIVCLVGEKHTWKSTLTKSQKSIYIPYSNCIIIGQIPIASVEGHIIKKGILGDERRCYHSNWWPLSNFYFLVYSNMWYPVITPWARSHLHSAGPHPSHASFTTRSSCPHPCGNQCDNTRWGPNVTIPNHLSH